MVTVGLRRNQESTGFYGLWENDSGGDGDGGGEAQVCTGTNQRQSGGRK